MGARCSDKAAISHENTKNLLLAKEDLESSFFRLGAELLQRGAVPPTKVTTGYLVRVSILLLNISIFFIVQ